ncbi:MAG: hypothetical protein KDA53_15985 [Hyphomonas sp.]|nr:hypothetical protein [Hyphomonas sp.]
MGPRRRIGPALAGVLEGLKLARREWAAAASDPPRGRWVPVGLVSALQDALVAALSAYDSARDEDVADPSNPEHLAPVTLLLRRARSQEYLDLPERLELSGAGHKAVETVIAARNGVLHGSGEGAGALIAADVRAVLGVLAHLCRDHPAFPAEGNAVMLALIADQISAFGRELAEAG